MHSQVSQVYTDGGLRLYHVCMLLRVLNLMYLILVMSIYLLGMTFISRPDTAKSDRISGRVLGMMLRMSNVRMQRMNANSDTLCEHNLVIN